MNGAQVEAEGVLTGTTLAATKSSSRNSRPGARGGRPHVGDRPRPSHPHLDPDLRTRPSAPSSRPSDRPVPRVSPRTPGALGATILRAIVTISLNGEPYGIDGPLSVASLLERLQIDSRRVAVELNLEVVRRARYHETLVGPGDQVEIVNFVGGG